MTWLNAAWRASPPIGRKKSQVIKLTPHKIVNVGSATSYAYSYYQDTSGVCTTEQEWYFRFSFPREGGGMMLGLTNLSAFYVGSSYADFLRCHFLGGGLGDFVAPRYSAHVYCLDADYDPDTVTWATRPLGVLGKTLLSVNFASLALKPGVSIVPETWGCKEYDLACPFDAPWYGLRFTCTRDNMPTDRAFNLDYRVQSVLDLGTVIKG